METLFYRVSLSSGITVHFDHIDMDALQIGKLAALKPVASAPIASGNFSQLHRDSFHIRLSVFFICSNIASEKSTPVYRQNDCLSSAGRPERPNHKVRHL
jgi:hypothetical protein